MTSRLVRARAFPSSGERSTPFRKSSRGFLDAMVAMLCLWAAAYHTPVGALTRSLGAWITGGRSSARPLLAYYSAGVYDAPAPALTPHLAMLPVRPPSAGPLPPDSALGYGAYAALMALPAAARAPIIGRAVALGANRERVEDSREGPLALGKVLRAREAELGSSDVALAALFWGEDEARYARDRVRARGDAPDLAALAAELPPGHADEVAAASQAATLGTAFALAWPVPESTRITSPFGMRLHPVLGFRKLHTGVDLGVPEGSAVHAVAAGVVRRASEDGVNGRVVIIDHGRGVTTAYCHNEALLVHTGDRVSRGQLLARSGSTGRSTGPHLHYQLDLGGNPVDPLQFRVTTAKVEDASLAAGD